MPKTLVPLSLEKYHPRHVISFPVGNLSSPMFDPWQVPRTSPQIHPKRGERVDIVLQAPRAPLPFHRQVAILTLTVYPGSFVCAGLPGGKLGPGNHPDQSRPFVVGPGRRPRPLENPGDLTHPPLPDVVCQRIPLDVAGNQEWLMRKERNRSQCSSWHQLGRVRA